MIYAPRIDFTYGSAIWILPLILLLLLSCHLTASLAIIFILSILLSIWIWVGTVYIIEGGDLFIKCWIFRRRVKIADISNIVKTKNILSSYALSVERLCLTEKGKGHFYLSPKNVDDFIEELKKSNPGINFS